MRFLLISLVFSTAVVLGQDVPTLYPVSPFDPNNDADQLFNAIDGWGTDENKIVSILCHRTATQRDEITSVYNSRHGNLASDLQSDLNGSFQTIAVMLTHGTAKFLSIELHETMARAGTDEISLTEIVLSRSNQDLSEVRNFYIDYYGHSLASDIEADTAGAYQSLMIQMAEGQRDESNVVNMTLVEQDAFHLYEAGPDATGTRDKVFIDIFTLRNFGHLNEVAIHYEATYGASLSTVCINEFAKDMGNALASTLQYSRDKASYFAARFHTTIAGMGTEDRNLMRLTVSRCEIDLGNIKDAYQRIHGQSLNSAVASDTSGSYGDALLALIG